MGVEGRADLLKSLGSALELHPEFFKPPSSSSAGSSEGEAAASSPCRFGHLVDYLLTRANDKKEVRDTCHHPSSLIKQLKKKRCAQAQQPPLSLSGGSVCTQVSVHELWRVIMYGLESIWPSGRTAIEGHNMGDVWPHSALERSGDDPSSGYVPFHKLSQWLGYSLLEPLAEAGLVVKDTEAMTGLPEYRNGGLFVDMGVLLPKYDEVITSDHLPDEEVIIEWRALTVMLLVRRSTAACEDQGWS